MHTFYKYQGTGNDFIIFDNRDGSLKELTSKKIAELCNRHLGIGADGLMLMNKKDGYDFEMKYFNSDGKESTMCGNGGRCMIRFAYNMGIHQYSYHFVAADGEHIGEIDQNDLIRLKMKDVHNAEIHNNHAVLDTGSPHYIKHSGDINQIQIVEEGKKIRKKRATTGSY